MEEKVKFYDREELDSKDILELIRIWEGGAGESFTDYCCFQRQSDADFLTFLSVWYEPLYDYCVNRIVEEGGNYLEYTIQYVADYCVDYYTSWIPGDNHEFWDKSYEIGMYPLAHFIKKNDLAWKAFVEFFTDTDNTCSGTPYIDCYNIRKQFEDDRKF
jgi:hypothetical protein